MDFGMALDALKDGLKVAREGWNGKGMYIILINGNTEKTPVGEHGEALGVPENFEARLLAFLMFKTADNDFIPWVASQADLLAEDWKCL